MSVFNVDGMEPALDKMIPAPVVEAGMENKINDAQGAERPGHALTVFAIWSQGKRIILQKWHMQMC
jgi:hypothetical protein